MVCGIVGMCSEKGEIMCRNDEVVLGNGVIV